MYMTLNRLNNKNVDRSKWDRLVEQQGVGRIYFLTDYLDAVCHDWDALVYGDYEAVMPLPSARYFFFGRRHDVPLFVQQLGIIGLKEDQKEVRSLMIKTAANTFPEFIYSFCHENGPVQLNKYTSIKRTNFELDLSQDYISIRSKYSQNLIRKFKKIEGGNLLFKKSREFELLKSFVQNHSQYGDPSSRKIETIKGIFSVRNEFYSPSIYSIWQNNQPWAVCFAPRFQNRITLLIPRSSDGGRAINAMAILIDQIIQQNAGTDTILDFEGSMLPGVAQFYKSFGGEDRSYTLLNKI